MRPRVIRIEGQAAGGAAFDGEQHAVITHVAAIVGVTHVSHELSVLRPLDTEPAALIRVGGRGARVVNHSTECAGPTGEVDSRVDWLLAPYMRRLGPQIARRQEPVRRNLSLDAQVPRRSGRGSDIEGHALHIRVCGKSRIGTIR